MTRAKQTSTLSFSGGGSQLKAQRGPKRKGRLVTVNNFEDRKTNAVERVTEKVGGKEQLTSIVENFRSNANNRVAQDGILQTLIVQYALSDIEVSMCMCMCVYVDPHAFEFFFFCFLCF
jgi:hypothetical protein